MLAFNVSQNECLNVLRSTNLRMDKQQQQRFSSLLLNLRDEHLHPQLLDGLEVLRRNALTPLKREFIAHGITSTYRNLTAPHFTRSAVLLRFHLLHGRNFNSVLGEQVSLAPVCHLRLGHLSCLADPEDLLVYKDSETFGVVQNIILNCTRDKHSLSSRLVATERTSIPSLLQHLNLRATVSAEQVSSLLLDNAELKAPSSLRPARLAELSPFLPSLGAPFLQALTQSQLLAALPALSSVAFSPAQVDASFLLLPVTVINIRCQ